MITLIRGRLARDALVCKRKWLYLHDSSPARFIRSGLP
jgi:hypothetical protein